MFTLTLIYLEYESSVSLCEFEMMIVIKWYFCLHFSSLHDYIHKTNETEFINELWYIIFFYEYWYFQLA